MRPLEERIADLQKKMEKKMDCGCNDESLNSRYKELLKQKFANYEAKKK